MHWLLVRAVTAYLTFRSFKLDALASMRHYASLYYPIDILGWLCGIWDAFGHQSHRVQVALSEEGEICTYDVYPYTTEIYWRTRWLWYSSPSDEIDLRDAQHFAPRGADISIALRPADPAMPEVILRRTENKWTVTHGIEILPAQFLFGQLQLPPQFSIKQ